jgi:hypothetical protein
MQPLHAYHRDRLPSLHFDQPIGFQPSQITVWRKYGGASQGVAVLVGQFNALRR